MAMANYLVPIVCCSLSALVGVFFGVAGSRFKVFPARSFMLQMHTAFLIGYRCGFAKSNVMFRGTAELARFQLADASQSWSKHWESASADYADWTKTERETMPFPGLPS